MTILDKIIRDKQLEVVSKKELVSTQQLEAFAQFERKTISLSKALRYSSSGIIAEHKRRSPSKGFINQEINLQDVAIGYEKAGACGMSVLTDLKYFGGSLEDLLMARATCNLPLLRKDFIVDEFQILEAKAYGADVILLIAAVLTQEEIIKFSELAKSLQLEVLLEVHNQDELERSIIPNIDMIGVNNRNLKTFEVNLDISRKLSKMIPDDFVKVSESGISGFNQILALRTFGYKGFLIGEQFMKDKNPGKSAKKFIKNFR